MTNQNCLDYDYCSSLKLPCKIGDKCWKILHCIDQLGYYTGKFKIVEDTISGLSVEIEKDRVLLFVHLKKDNDKLSEILFANGDREIMTGEKHIKSIYFDYKEAEAKLKELKGENNINETH